MNEGRTDCSILHDRLQKPEQAKTNQLDYCQFLNKAVR